MTRKDKMLELIDRGKTQTEVAASYGISQSRVSYIYRERRPPMYRPRKTITPDHRYLIALHRAGKSFTDIAAELDMTKGQVAGLIHRGKKMMEGEHGGKSQRPSADP